MKSATQVALEAPHAHAASCYGGSCTKQDPAGMGCNDNRTYTADAESFYGTVLQLRISPTCNAAWVRAISDSCRGNVGGSIEAFWQKNNECTRVAGRSVTQPCYSTEWSTMLSFNYWGSSLLAGFVRSQWFAGRCSDAVGRRSTNSRFAAVLEQPHRWRFTRTDATR